jgi:hypothetical protein
MSLVYKLIAGINDKLSEKVIIGFKAYMLYQVTLEKANLAIYVQNDVARYKRSLDEIVFRYR